MLAVTVKLQSLGLKENEHLLFSLIGSKKMISFNRTSKKLLPFTIGALITLAFLLNPLMIQTVNAMMPTDNSPTPHYFGPYPNYATSQFPTVTYDELGNIIDVTGGIRKFIDSLPLLGPEGINNLNQYLPVAVADNTTYPGSNYYEIAVVEFMQQMHTDLPPTKLRGYVQIATPIVSGAHVALNNTDGSPILLANGTQAYGVDIPRYLGPFIVAEKDLPVRIKFYNLLPTGAGGDLFLPVDTTVMGSGMGPTPMLMPNGMPHLNPDGSIMYESYTQNRATLHLHGGRSPWISDGTTHQWITPAGEDTAYPKGVSVYNVPDMPEPEDGAMTFYYTNQQSARLMFYHDHSYGITRLNVYAGEAAGYLLRDAVEQSLISSGIIPADEIPLVIQDKTFVPDNTTPITNIYGNFSSQLDFQDPTWNTTLWGGPGSLWYPHVYVPMQNPGDPSGMNVIGRWHYGPWFWPPTVVEQGPKANPYYVGGSLYNASYPYNSMEPPLIPGTPNLSMPGEAFMDTPVINGVAYPYLEVDPKAYRFRILNAADDRFFNLQMYVADSSVTTFDGRTNTEVKMVPAVFNTTYPDGWPIDGRAGGIPDPTTAGPSFIQIGNEGGFLPAPVVLPNQPIDWNTDMGTFDAGVINKGALRLGTAERADVIVDFSQFAGKTIILYNDNPAPEPASDPRQDYYTGREDMTESGGSSEIIPGYGSNTRTIMQIRVADIPAEPSYNLTALEQAFSSTPTTEGAFAAAQTDIIVPQTAYSSAYNTTLPDVYSRIFDNSLTFNPLGSNTSVTIDFQPKMIQDEMGESYDPIYGRMAVFLGTELVRSTAGRQTMLLYGFADPPTEIIAPSIEGTQIGTLDDGTQIWKITHNGVDVHTVHWHMFEVQLINRVAWDNNIRMPDGNELGWKETIRVNPLQDTIVALRPIVPDVPFDIPNSIRPIDPTMPLGATLKTTGIFDVTGEPITLTNHLVNFGWEYVWHCHILAHEEMDMMRAIVIAVPPKTPLNLTVSNGTGMFTLKWVDNSLSETGFTIQRANDANFTTGLTTFNVAANVTNYVDNAIQANIPYYYRVKAINLVGDTTIYPAPAEGFPTMTAESAFSNSAVGMITGFPPNAPSNLRTTFVSRFAIRLAWNDNSNNENGFIIQRAADSAFTTELATFTVAANVRSFTDNTVEPHTRYYYRVIAYNQAGNSTPSNTVNVVSGFAPNAPSRLRSAFVDQNIVIIVWNDNSNNEEGFIIQRATNNAFTQGLTTFNVDANVRAYIDAAVSPNTRYYYRVQAYNIVGNSAFSNTLNVRTSR
jgi:FtsP/CotA-like multicopper oxidase with cupredoxin domain